MEMLWTDFLNSMWHDWRGSGRSEDRLDNPAWLTSFLAEHNLVAPVPPLPTELEVLRALRAWLRALAKELAAGGALTPADLQELNRVLAGGVVTRQVSPEGIGYRLELAPARQDWPQVMAEIAASFAGTLAEGERGRIRVCDNPDCKWIFYDDTRNRAKRFCDDKSCGNLMKVRRFRARQKAGHGNPDSSDADAPDQA